MDYLLDRRPHFPQLEEQNIQDYELDFDSKWCVGGGGGFSSCIFGLPIAVVLVRLQTLDDIIYWVGFGGWTGHCAQSAPP